MRPAASSTNALIPFLPATILAIPWMAFDRALHNGRNGVK
jgi:hypothetical protein